MTMTIARPGSRLSKAGIYTEGNIHFQLSAAELVQHTLRREEGKLADTGALVIQTGEFTGRCPKDKYIVYDNISRDRVNWNEFNLPISP